MLCDHLKKKSRKSHHITKFPVKYEKCFILRMVEAFHISIVKGEEWGMLGFFLSLQ